MRAVQAKCNYSVNYDLTIIQRCREVTKFDSISGSHVVVQVSVYCMYACVNNIYVRAENLRA